MKVVLFATLLIGSLNSHASCEVLSSTGKPVTQSDGLFKSISDELDCPKNVFELKQILVKSGLEIKPSMVANRGIHNPNFGSFSVFESVVGNSDKFSHKINDGDFFFGHFTAKKGNTVDLDQSLGRGKLIIELISWDYKKGYYNFYELIGTGNSAVWFYRGDTKDAYLDNFHLKKQPNISKPKFGKIMRCSACHTSGGPIMKELEAPHNDWWTEKKKLKFGSSSIGSKLGKTLQGIVAAEDFSISVKNGISKLENSSNFQKIKKSLSLKEQLRPLFCTTEVNIESSNSSVFDQSGDLVLSSSAWANPLLLKTSLSISKKSYVSALKSLGMKFPENGLLDSDHSWLVPVKGFSSNLKIEHLVKDGVIDKEFASDVLMIDFQNPMFSEKRCELLKLVPSSTNNWVSVFKNNLSNSSKPGAKELFKYLTQPDYDLMNHKKKVQIYINDIQKKLKSLSGVKAEVSHLQKIRKSVFKDEISKNPLGQILEPGFRVIFPFFNE